MQTKRIPRTAVNISERYQGLLRRDCPSFTEGEGIYEGLGLCRARVPHPAFEEPSRLKPAGLAWCVTCPWHDKEAVVSAWNSCGWNLRRQRQRQNRPTTLLPERRLRRWQMDKAHLREALGALGLGTGDVVQIHSSLGNLGQVQGGADAVVDALVESVGDSGTVFSPVFVEEAIDCMGCEGQDFCPSDQPSEMGMISEVLRLRDEALRSCSPSHAFCGIGPQAEQVIAAQKEVLTPCAPDSVFEWLYRLDGYIVCLGVGIESMTGFHFPEEVLEIPNIGVYDPRTQRLYYTPMGRRINYTYPHLITELLAAAGILRHIRIGLADLYCLPVVRFFDFLAAALLDDPTCLHLYPTGATPDLFLDAASKAGRMLKVWRQSKTEDASP